MSTASEVEAARVERDRLRELVAWRTRLRSEVLEHVLAGWWTWDVPTDALALSPGFRRRLGLEPDAPVPEALAETLKGALIGQAGPRVVRPLALPTPTRTVQLEARAEALGWTADGQVSRWRVGNVDIQRLIDAEREARERVAARAEQLAFLNLELAAQAEQLERSNAALEDFAYAASHDLQVPLRAIAHFAAWIDEDLPANTGEEVRGHVARLLNRVERLSQLHADLLAYAQVAHQPIDWRAGEPMRVIFESWARVGDARLELRAAGMTGACLVPVEQLGAILDQLLSNAIRHHDRPRGMVEVRVGREGEALVVEVEDDGPGIEPRFAEQAFKVLETLRPRDAGAGSGIGLSIARKHARRVGGELALVERAGRGALFRLSLPFRAL